MLVHVLLLLCLQQSGWALQLTAPLSHQARLGGDVNIPCSFTINNPPIDHRYLAIFWYFHGKEILRVQNKIETITDPRVSYTGRAEDGIADLSISNITIIDGGIYKCSILYTPKREEKEIRLDIQAPPQINITDRVVTNEESSLQSVISGFYPEEIDIKWLRDGEILDKSTKEKPQRDQDGTYHVRSSVTLTPTEEDRERIFSCRVQHESLTAPLQEDFQLVYGDIPTVQIISQEIKMNVEQKLVCNVSGFYPESITVNWFLNDTLLENAKTRRTSSSAIESVYLFTPTEQNRGMELRCVVEHGTLISPHVERLLVQGADMTPQYKLHTVFASVVLVLIIGVGTIIFLFVKQKKSFPKVKRITRSSATFSLAVNHFYPDNITVCWKVFQPPSSTEPHNIGSTTVMHPNQDGTFNATSTCESLRGLIREDEPYIVRAVVEHNKLKHPKQRDWRSDDKENEGIKGHFGLQCPHVDVIDTSALVLNTECEIQCNISGYSPENLTVSWYKKNWRKSLVTDEQKYNIPEITHQIQPDNTYSCTARLRFTPLRKKDQGSEFICRVEHPSMDKPIERHTGPLHIEEL